MRGIVKNFGFRGLTVTTAASLVCFSAFAWDLTGRHLAQNDLPPAAIPGAASDNGEGDAAQMTLRIDRLESDLRRATGAIEELQNQNQRLAEELRRFREDVEFRLGGKGAVSAAPAVPALPPPAVALQDTPLRPRKADAFDPNQDPNAQGAPKPLGSTPPSAPLTRTAGVAGAPLDLASRPPAAAPAPAPASPTPQLPAGPLAAPSAGPTVINSGLDFSDGPRTQFSAGVDAYKAGQYDVAESQLKGFLAANPTHRMAPDAIFFLGETYLQRSRPREAAEQYLKISTDYAKSTRAPEGMMRLGQSLALLGNSEQACATFAEVGKRYPTASSSVKKTVEREMQKDHC